MHPSRLYLRFVIQAEDYWSGRRQGLFHAMEVLEQSGTMTATEQDDWRELYGWFRQNLPVPDRFSRAAKTHAKKVALSWFKPGATEHIAKMRQIAVILAAHGHRVEMIRSDRPGYVVYEDEHQIAAEPFRETTT